MNQLATRQKRPFDWNQKPIFETVVFNARDNESMIRTRFRVESVSRSMGWKRETNGDKSQLVEAEVNTVKLRPVFDPDNHTKVWASGSVGQIELNALKSESGNDFVIGGEYFVDFTKVES